MLFHVSGQAQKAASPKVLTAIKVNSSSLKALWKGMEYGAYSLNKKGILRPTEGFKMLYDSEKQVLIIIPEKETYSTFLQIKGYEDIELLDGTIIGCMCNEQNDTCKFSRSREPGVSYKCGGSCRCFIGVIFEMNKPPAEYETPGGRWFNF